MHSHELLPILSLLSPEALSRLDLPDLAGQGDGGGPGTYLLRGPELAKLRDEIRSGNELLSEGCRTLLELADQACTVEPMSVRDKEAAPEGGTLNDYCSLARYTWPNPESADGMPYLLRDGEVNPDTYDERRFDASRLERLASTLFVLSIAYYVSGEKKYGEASARHLRRWFVDSESRQNPNFRFAQLVPGETSLRGIGIIEARRYLYVIDAEALISDCEAWSRADRVEFRRWFSDFFAWLRTSEQGAHAASKDNNIGLWYDLQCAIYALFLGERRLAEVILRESHSRRLVQQVSPDGSQPGEMRRAQPYDYVLFNLLAIMGLARAGELAGFESLWTDSSDGRSFQRALDWLLSIVRSKDGSEPGPVRLLSLLELRQEKLEIEERLQEKLRLVESVSSQLAAEITKREAVGQALASMKGAFETERKSNEDRLVATTEALGERTSSLAAATAALEEHASSIEQTRAELAEVKNLLAAELALRQQAAEKIGQQGSRIRELSQELERAQKLTIKYHGWLREVYSSRSWRITQPLRRVVGWLRRDRAWNARMAEADAVALPVLMTPEMMAREAAGKEVRVVRAKLLNLGFHERGLRDLRAMAGQGADPWRRHLAAWELAVWHANRHTVENAETCLGFLDMVSTQKLEPEQERRLAILKGECLRLQGNPVKARRTLTDQLGHGPHADLYLGLACIEPDSEARLAHINETLQLHGLSPIALEGGGGAPYDRIVQEAKGPRPVGEIGGPLVTVIVPAFNAEQMIGTTLRSLLAQTWRNIEVIVSDDCSTDRTCEVVEGFARTDARVRLLRGQRNSGPYVARNLALQAAKGELVTCNDSDDWSHSRKIEIQARHLLSNETAVANISPQARMYEDLTFYRRGNPGFYVQPNMSSLMFRRALVDRIGYWDSVRFAADSEFTRRIKAVFGNDAIVDLDVGPLSFQRQTQESLTGSQCFGYHGFKMGARREYEQAHSRFHGSGNPRFIQFPLQERPFVVPEPMRPDREVGRNEPRRFDVVLASDFRMPGGTSMSNAEEIKANRRMGLRTALVQLSRYDVNPGRSLNPAIAGLIDGEHVDLVVYGERIECDLLVVRLPWVLEEWQEYVPQITAKNVRVIVNQPPKRDYAEGSEYIYHLGRCAAHMRRYFGQVGTWHPIGPLVRQALVDHHADELAVIDLSDEDWPNIIDVAEWRRPLRPEQRNRIHICRHSRDQYVKWPATREDLLTVYPDSDRYEVHILGGAEVPRKLLGGKLPDHWRVKNFGKERPQRFLAKGDVFVYYTHPDWVESFGRVIFEAMATGVPVILPPIYEPLFRQSAIYAEPSDALLRVDELMADDALYEGQAAIALEFVETHFGYSRHAQRMGEILGRDLVACLPESARRVDDVLGGSARVLASFDDDRLVTEERMRRDDPGSQLSQLVEKLIAEADEALSRGRISVIDKTTLPPSGDHHDYWHPAPYWWPNPESPDGLPYVRRDGERVPGTLMYEPDSAKYDRTRLQHLFDDSTMLALAWKFTGREVYVAKAVEHLRCFFLDPLTGMSPHLKYAQVRMGHDGNRGWSTGLIEMKDLYYYLDAVRLMVESGALGGDELAAFRGWLSKYLRWLLGSFQGTAECRSRNNHGTYYDLQVAAIAAFLDQRELLLQTLQRARNRIADQFAADGSQPEELDRTTTAHYCCFNFQGWANLAGIAEKWGYDLWNHEPADGGSLMKGAEWLLAHAGKPWPYKQIDAFDPERFLPVWFGLPSAPGGLPRPQVAPSSRYLVKPRFHPHDGIRPYWNLG